jgi:NAD(P)-dependent dehydrogenase (short-subunit alcohol dehydrogenase family)
MRLKDRVALITGAGHGIGRATALEFVREGAAVVVNDVNAERAASVTEELRALGGKARAAVADIADEAAVKRMVAEATSEFGRVDILVNNAGGQPPGIGWKPFHESTLEEIRRSFDLNFFGHVNCTRAVIEGMIARRYGKIVSISSISAVFGQQSGMAYAAAKGALEAFSASVGKEVAKHGVNVNILLVGLADTQPREVRSPERYQLLCDWSHFGRLGQPEEFARAILFLASDDSSYMSGAILPVDGGILRFGPL